MTLKVNQMKAPMVSAGTAAKRQSKNHQRMPQTRPISKIVGMTLNMTKNSRNSIDLAPRSSARLRPAGLPVQVKAQRQRQQMAKGRERDLADRVLSDPGEDGIAQLAEGHRQDSTGAVGQKHPQRHDEQSRVFDAQGIDRLAQEKRDINVGELGRDQQSQRDDHPRLQIAPAARPEIGQHSGEGGPVLAAELAAFRDGRGAHSGSLSKIKGRV